MPHVIVKLYPGKSERQKMQLSDAIVDAVTSILGYGEESVSVAVQDVSSADWKETVYRHDILAHSEILYKKPGYMM